MHELGILRQIIRVVSRAAVKNNIQHIKHITLEIGRASGIVPRYMIKMFPVAADAVPLLKNAELKIRMVFGNGLLIKDIGY